MNKKQNPTDRFLILQYKAGNTAVLPILVKRYHKAFCKKAYWVVKDKEIAKDVAQECWIKILDKLDTLEHLERFKSWAFRIVYTMSIDAIKRKNKESQNLKSVNIPESSTQSTEEQNLLEKTLLTAIRKLPKEKQDIIRLFYTEEYSIAEISTFLGIPIGTVKSRLFKAREKLKRILALSEGE